ncbi:MAG: DNA translocase FtsK [Butyricicoccus sp.]|nr:DNA translocase FtsK [Butyricicoccus sp.]
MAQTKRKSTKSTSRSRSSKASAAPAPDSYLPRPAWGVIYGILGVLVLLALVQKDGAVLHLLHTALGSLIGYGLYVLPFSLFGLAALLIARTKGPVRLRAGSIGAFPLIFGALAHGMLRGGQFPISLKAFSLLMQAGANLKSGGLLAGGLYCLMEWAFSGIGAMILMLILLVVDAMVMFRLTPQTIYNALRPIDYEYDSDEEREKYEAPAVLPNVHELAAARKAKRKTRAAFDIPLDGEDEADEPIVQLAPEPVPAPEPLVVDEPEKDPFGDILSLLHGKKKPEAAPAVPDPEDVPEPIEDDTPPWEEPLSKAEQKKRDARENAAMAAEMDRNVQAPAPEYSYPPMTLLNPPKTTAKGNYQQELSEYSHRLIDTLQSFNIEAQIIGIVRGPTVTRFEVTIPPGTKFSRITGLADDIALALGAVSVRIAPIPEKVAIGIEVPNKTNTMVPIYDVLNSDAFKKAKSHVAFCVGKDITGAPVVGNIGKMPHLLIAGTTGSGKSVCVNSMLISLLYKSTPEQVRLIMVDPKMVELGNYNGIPHLLIPVVTDPRKAAGALNWAVGEMERRYKLFADNQVRKLEDYNDLMRKKKAEAEAAAAAAPVVSAEDGEEAVPAPAPPIEQYQTLPEIVIVIDELADLMMVAAKEVETSICRIAQKARAAGMYLIVATQRPSADVITGIMKANIPSRIAFAVASQIESRIILDTTGAEKLIGKGDMLYAPLGEGKPQRIQGCFISNDEIENVIEFIKSTSTAEYNEEILEHIEKQAEAAESGGSGGGFDPAEDEDEMLMDAIDVVMDCKQASVSMLQRRLKLGYARAARIVDQMEERGIVGPFEGSKPRQILISKDDWNEMKLRRKL